MFAFTKPLLLKFSDQIKRKCKYGCKQNIEVISVEMVEVGQDFLGGCHREFKNCTYVYMSGALKLCINRLGEAWVTSRFA